MKKRVLCLMVDGFEELEVVAPVDVLRRAGVEVVLAGMGQRMVVGRNGIRLECDEQWGAVEVKAFDLLMLPGGPGVASLRGDGRARELAQEFVAGGKWVGAICAAPLILKDAGLLDGRVYTAHQSVVAELGGSSGREVEVSDRVITSRGAGTALAFGLAMVECLMTVEVAERIMRDMMV